MVGVLALIGGLLFRAGNHRAPEPQPAVSSHLVSAKTPIATPPSVPAAASPNHQFTARTGRFVPGPVEPDRARAAVEAFAAWAGKFASNNPSVTVTEGEALAWKRREAMRELIQTDPAQALTLAVPYAWRQSLPPQITQFFEEQVDGRGDYMVAEGTDFSTGATTTFRNVQVAGRTFAAFVYGRRQAEVSQTAIPLHGIALDGKLALSSEPLRKLTVAEAAAINPNAASPDDVICSVSGQPAGSRGTPVYAESGGGVLCFCGEDHYKLVNQQWALAESGGSQDTLGTFNPDSSATAANDAWTHGIKTVLYIRVNFPDDLTEPISMGDAYATMDGVNTYYTENSYNLSSITTMVTPLITLPQTKEYYSTDPTLLLADARAAA